MISIKAVYIGNSSESFIEDHYSDDMNVIYSLDNNRGKTIVMQGMAYTLGAMPTFPDGFPYREYMYIVDLDVNGNEMTVLRSRDTFAVKTGNKIEVLDSVEAFSRFWNDNVFELPVIVKDGRAVIVGLELYTQLFFVGQDDLSSAKVKAGRFNKNDYEEMLYSMAGLNGRTLEPQEIQKLKRRRDALRGRLGTLSKEAAALKQRGTALSVISATTDRRDMDELAKSLDQSRKNVSALRKKRSRLIARRTKNQIVLDELNSLKINVKVGELTCLECGSTDIGYRMADSGVVFDVTTSEMRTQIINSVHDRIDDIDRELDTTARELRHAQANLDALLEDNSDITLADIVACKDVFLDAKEIDAEIQSAQNEIDTISDMLASDRELSSELKQRQEEFRKQLLSAMNYARQTISGNPSEAAYSDLFTTQANVLSGSDGTIYFASRLYAIAKTLNHPMPLLFDSFRADDLSSDREDRLLNLFSSLKNQMIMTTTIKREEGPSKYQDDTRVNAIDYSSHRVDCLLSDEYNGRFTDKAADLGILLG